MKEKIKLLLVPSDTQGVGHFRSIWPAQSIQRNFKDIIDVEINPAPNVDNLNYLTSFDIIHFHRHLGPYENSDNLFKKLRDAGVLLIMDIDDFWEPPTTHPLYEIVKKDKLGEKIENNLKLSDYVTTTTNVFAKVISKFNPNVEVLPNAIDLRKKMWKSEVEENKSGKCRISWIGGSSHLHDLELMRTSMRMLHDNKSLEDKFQIIMCGFDTRGNITEIRPDGSRSTRAIQPHETVWCRFEEIFTNDYKGVKDEEYTKWLKSIKRENYEGQEFKNYIRRWTLPLTKYGYHYDYCDVCLAPLVDVYEDRIEHVNKKTGKASVQIMKKRHTFNEVKSELKIIEAGMKKKVLIAQDFGIYKELIEDGVTGLLVKDNKDGWYKAMKKIIENPEYREELANNLHEWVKDRYELKTVTTTRLDFYVKMNEKHKKKLLQKTEKSEHSL